MDDTGKNISVIIPAYNMGDWVGSAIESVANTSVEGVEVIVVDDGSEDATPSVVRRYAEEQTLGVDVRFYRQENQGKSNAVNRGLREAHGDYVSILDADDQIADGGLDVLFRSRVDDEGVSYPMIVGGFEVFNRSGTFGRRIPPPVHSPERLHARFYLHWRTPFHLNACLFSRELCERAGSFDVRLRRCQDIDYSLRLLKAANQIAWVHEPVYRYRKHRSNYLERARVRRKTLTHRPLAYWKNYEGWRRYAAVFAGMVLDAGKFLYEIAGNYQN